MIRSFERYIIRLTARMTLTDVSNELGLSWNTVRDIHKEYLKRKYSKPYNFKELYYLGIDEFSIGKNHDYMTIFINLDTAQIIHAVEGRNKEAIIPFIKKLVKKAVNLKAVAMDMSGPYESAMKEFFPFLNIVFDRFHIMKLINEAIDEIRREQQRLYKEAGNDVLKGGRYLLLKNLNTLDSTQTTNLKILLEMNAPLATAHQMKEQFRQFWNQGTRHNAMRFILEWVWSSNETKIPAIARVGRTLLRHSDGLLNYYNHMITNATTEGINNKIETLKRQAYGYRDMEYFKLRLYHLHAQKTELLG
jgi:transposase